jgi:hypothetical protein
MNLILTWLKTTVLRLQATSPAYFKALKWASVIIIAICTALLNSLPQETLDIVVIAAFGWTLKLIIAYIITGFTFVFGTSSLTAKDPQKDVANKL